MDSFKSVNDFLHAVRTAKQDTASLIEDELAPMVEDSDAICITPALLSSIEELLKDYGDEVLRSLGMFCLGKWIGVHEEMIRKRLTAGAIADGLQIMSDMSRLLSALELIKAVGSFGGDEEWRRMIKKEVGKAVMEVCEEKGMSIDDFFLQ